MKQTIFRYEVPVDGEGHVFALPHFADVLHVDCREIDAVEFWAYSGPCADLADREFVVVGTGQPFHDSLIHRGTAVAPRSQLVWHLMEFPAKRPLATA